MSHVFPRAMGRDLPIVERGEGALVWDTAGKRYVDAAGGAIVVGVGHGDRAVIDALERQVDQISYVHGTQFTSRALEDYAEQIAPLLPVDEARIYPVSGGSEAVETALKIARAYFVVTGRGSRHKVIARAGSYHGNTLGALDASGREVLREPYEPWLGRTIRVPAVYEYRCELEGHPHGCGARHAEILDATIRREGPDTVACFIAEPVVGAALGGVPPPPDYWIAIVEVCRTHGVLVVVDEVMTGFGRTGTMFACEHWGIAADILAAGKGASSGYWPFGFAACSEEIFNALTSTGFTHGFTYSHSVVGAAVAKAVLDRLRGDDLVEASRDKGELMIKMLEDALGDHPNVGDIRGLGLMIGVELVMDRESKTPFRREQKVTEKILASAQERGVLLYPSTAGADGRNGDVIMLGPPLVITEDQMQEAADTLTAAISAVLRGA
jgi:adenosylmethionine-8-amino-7-oxononanoate aminotransferase